MSILVSKTELGYNNIKGESAYGIGFNAMVGIEWWVGKDWGIGAVLYIYCNTMKDKGEMEDNTINNFFVGMLFPATYN